MAPDADSIRKSSIKEAHNLSICGKGYEWLRKMKKREGLKVGRCDKK